jgi:hypothetical protein
MTWDKLQERIAKMSEEEKKTPVKFFDTYGDGCVFEDVKLYKSEDDEEASEGEVKAGDYYLAL